MIMFTVTKPRRKLKRVLQAAALVLLLAVVVPGIYHSLESVGAMSLFASGDAVSGSEEQAAQPEATTELEAAAQPEATTEPEAADQSETTAGTEAATSQADDENAPVDEAASDSENEAETESFWQPLLRVLFGDKSQVTSY